MSKEKEEQQKKNEQQEQKKDVAIDWADVASQELADYIEEQGIQIRY